MTTAWDYCQFYELDETAVGLLEPHTPITDGFLKAIPVRRHNRLRTAIGRAGRKHCPGKFSAGELVQLGKHLAKGNTANKMVTKSQYWIDLHRVLFSAYCNDFMRHTFIHELAHVINWVQNGPRVAAHGAAWRGIMDALGEEPKPIPLQIIWATGTTDRTKQVLSDSPIDPVGDWLKDKDSRALSC